MTRGEFARRVLESAKLHAPVTIHTRRALQAEMQAEGGSARFNPFNTTRRLPGSSNYNSVGVQNYASPQQGIEATVLTLMENQPGYARIRKRLRSNASAPEILKAIGESSWGTDGKLALAVLDDIRHDRAPNRLTELEQRRVAGSD
jgi:hypothetical protein